MSTEKLLELKAITSVSRKGVIGLITMLVYSFLVEFVFVVDGPFLMPSWLKWILYAIIGTGIVILGVDKPEMKKFMMIIQEALSDGKITLEEAMSMIRQGWFVLMGFWADVSQIENKEKKEKEEKEEEVSKLKAELDDLKNS